MTALLLPTGVTGFAINRVWRTVLTAAVLACAAGTPGRAAAGFIVNSGTPDQTSSLTIGRPTGPSQVVAQEFTLTDTASISTIEAFIGGDTGGSIRMDLTRSIGPSATAADVIASFNLSTPGTVPDVGAWVSANFNASLDAGTYYLVFSSGSGSSTTYLPDLAPNPTGTTYYALGGSIDSSLPIASDFSTLSTPEVSSAVGIRLSDTSDVSVVPAPSSLTLCGTGALCAFLWARVRRRTVIPTGAV